MGPIGRFGLTEPTGLLKIVELKPRTKSLLKSGKRHKKTAAAKTAAAHELMNQEFKSIGLGYILEKHYIMPPMPGFAAGAGSGAGMSVIAHSLVRMRAAMLAAF